MIKAVIFDMDGVIADTEPLHEKARNALLKELRLNVEKISPTAIGRSTRALWGEVVSQYSLPYTADELTVREFELLMKIAKNSGLRPSEGLPDLLMFLKERNIKAAVASSSDRNYVEYILSLMDLGQYFCATACGDEVLTAKPAPDVYLRALSLCGVKADETLAVEDSDTGAKAAAAAYIPCVAYDVVQDKKLKQKFDACSFKVHRMNDIENIVQGVNINRYAI